MCSNQRILVKSSITTRYKLISILTNLLKLVTENIQIKVYDFSSRLKGEGTIDFNTCLSDNKIQRKLFFRCSQT